MSTESETNTVQLRDPHTLLPHEEVMFPRALLLFARFVWDGFIARPVLVDANTGVILDGHHRWWVSKRLGFALIPCYCVNYLDDETVRCLPRRDDIPVSKELVIEKALAGGVFPAKTTRHLYELPATAAFSFEQLR